MVLCSLELWIHHMPQDTCLHMICSERLLSTWEIWIRFSARSGYLIDKSCLGLSAIRYGICIFFIEINMWLSESKCVCQDLQKTKKGQQRHLLSYFTWSTHLMVQFTKIFSTRQIQINQTDKMCSISLYHLSDRFV